MVENSAATVWGGATPKPPKKTPKKEAKPKNMPGTKVRPKRGMRASSICAAFRQNSTAHWNTKNAVPEKKFAPIDQPVTMSQAVIAPTNIVGTSLRKVSGFGPPAAK